MRSVAADPRAPYVRLAAGGLIARTVPGIAGRHLWLLLRRQGPVGHWDPPGGRLEEGEDLSAGVRREIMEETGLSVEVSGPCYAYLTFHKGERLLAVSMACRLTDEAEADRVRLGEEHVAWAWRTAEEWEALAAEGKSSWTPVDVRKVTRLAVEIWEVT